MTRAFRPDFSRPAAVCGAPLGRTGPARCCLVEEGRLYCGRLPGRRRHWGTVRLRLGPGDPGHPVPGGERVASGRMGGLNPVRARRARTASAPGFWTCFVQLPSGIDLGTGRVHAGVSRRCEGHRRGPGGRHLLRETLRNWSDPCTFQDVIMALAALSGPRPRLPDRSSPTIPGGGGRDLQPRHVLSGHRPRALERVAYVEPSRRPTDGRYGENPNRLQHYYQFQVILKPSPDNVQDICIWTAWRALGVHGQQAHDIRFVEDDWESPTLGASGAWAGKCGSNGMEVTQFTYFQQVGGIELSPVSVEITYGLERISMYLQEKESVYDLAWNDRTSPMARCYHQGEVRAFQVQFRALRPQAMLHGPFRRLRKAECKQASASWACPGRPTTTACKLLPHLQHAPGPGGHIHHRAHRLHRPGAQPGLLPGPALRRPAQGTWAIPCCPTAPREGPTAMPSFLLFEIGFEEMPSRFLDSLTERMPPEPVHRRCLDQAKLDGGTDRSRPGPLHAAWWPCMEDLSPVSAPAPRRS